MYLPLLRVSGAPVARSHPSLLTRRRGWGRAGEGEPGEEVALREVSAVDGEPTPLLLGLEAFGDDGHAEVSGELEELRGDRGAVRVPVHVLQQAHVELYEVRAQGGEEVQGAVTGAEVVEGDLKPLSR